MRKYKAVILAGGKGTRLYPITYEIPKPLLPVKRKPILSHLVDLFVKHGIKDIAVLINKEFREEFEWWKKRYHSNHKIFIQEEKKHLGTLGGLWSLKDWLSGNDFFMSNGDELKRIDLKKMAEFHQRKPVIATVALVKVKNPQDYGVVICKNGLVCEFIEKPKNPPSDYISSGLYMFSPEIFDYHPGPNKFSMIETDLLPKLVKENRVGGFKFQGKWIDCGTFQRYEEALKKWK
ncbi:nucleotidyltransferase family protein [bacterium]|nr:nucleotidyltransferase family protein [bacterium]